MLSSRCAGPVQCMYFRPEELRKTKTSPPPFGFHTQVLLNAACFAKFGSVRPLEGMVSAKTACVFNFRQL